MPSGAGRGFSGFAGSSHAGLFSRMTELKLLKSLFKKIRDTKKFRRAKWFLSRDETALESFLDLTPVDNADIEGPYRKALDFAMCNPAIRNVALTGPYGSGKTSVIKTYEKNSPFRFLNISLATFSDPNISNYSDAALTSEEDTVKVERSILQQMLYGADTSTLPYSRFKRITKPRWLSINALSFAFWIVVCGYLYHELKNILNVTTLNDVKLLWIFTGLYAFAYFAQIISRSLKASHSLSVKKLSLQNGEVELDGTPESSILNKHLDEIIYFFEENDYDVVVFEDLDRFGNPEIFIKLREINKIINDRPKRRGTLGSLRAPQPLKFIYAIKDDVFFNKDRAKFFDFITPIVPIINNSNSREMFAKCIAPEGNNVEVDSRFLSEVSLYLDDYRLIKNISNEFSVYQGKVGGVPNLNKLLAIIIYKNTYPRDFESLHHGKGALYNIVGLRTELIARAAADADVKIEALRQLIVESEEEFCSAQEDLVRIFWGQLCGGSPTHYINGIYAESEILTLEKLLNWDNFKKLFSESSVRIHGFVVQNGYNTVRQSQVSLGVSFREVEGKAIPGERFETRCERIKNKSTLKRNKINSEIANYKEDKAELARQPLHQLLIHASQEIDNAISFAEISDSRLLKYLVKNGYLDETYHLYISIFHEGRMSRNDWNFIQTIRDFRSVDPNTQIDNPREVVAEMRDEDFGAEYVLNVALIDYLLSTAAINTARLHSAVDFIAKHYSDAKEFFQAYWLSGRAVDEFTRVISNRWGGYGVASIGDDQSSKHIARILAYVDPSHISRKMNASGVLAQYLSTHSNLVFSETVPFANGYEALKLMSVKLEKLQDIAGLDDLANYACQNSLYSLSMENIDFALLNIFRSSSEPIEDLTYRRAANYTSIYLSPSQVINNYVWENINTYLKNVALAMEDNVKESREAILKIASHPEVDKDLAIQYALRQDCIFESFEDVPEFMWSELLINKKIVAEWDNILDYHRLEGADLDRLNEYLNEGEAVNALAGTSMPKADEEDKYGKALSWFLISNDSIDLQSFESLCKCSNYIYSRFPEGLPLDRKIILARIGKIALSEESFADASESVELKATLLKRHFTSYVKNMDKYPIDIEVKLALFSTLSEEFKPKVIKLMSLEEIKASTGATKKVSAYLATENSSIEGCSREVLLHCLVSHYGQSVSMDLLYKIIDILTDQEVTDALHAASEPYCHFVKANTRQKLANTERNMLFVRNLERRRIISSVSDEGSVIRVNAFRKGIKKFLLGDG